MAQETMRYDAIIIGAGLGGLVCGAYLAKAGMKLLIVEQHDKPGGYFTSFQRRGFSFDAAAHTFGNYREGGFVRKILTELGITGMVNIKRPDPSDIIVTPDFTIPFRNDSSKTLSALAAQFPHEQDGLAAFFDFLTSAGQSDFSKLKDKSFESFLQSYFKDTKLMNTLALPVLGYGGLPPSLMHAFNGVKVFTESMIDGGYYIEGGVQKLPDAFVAAIRQQGGSVIYRKAVREILVENSAAVGVALDGGETYRAASVISACDLTQTIETLLKKAPGADDMRSIVGKIEPSLSIFILYIGIDGPFEGLPPAGVNTWCLPHYDLDEIYACMQAGDLNKSGMYMMRVCPDRRTITAFTNVAFMSTAFWKSHKKTAAEDFLDRIERRMPGLKSHVVYFDAATPATLVRYTSNRNGAAYGWASTTSQMFMPELRRVPFKNLYFAGHWTGIGSGLPAVFYSGFDTAQRILKKNKK